MKITVDTQQLISALSTVIRAVPTKAVNPILECVLLEADGKTLTVIGSDGNLTLTAQLDAQVEEPGNAALPGKLLNEMTKRLPAFVTNLDMSGNKVKIHSGPFKANMTSQNAADYPLQKPEAGQIQKLTVNGARLREMISRTSYAMATDPTRIVLTGMLFEAADGKLNTVALDGFRMSSQETQTDAKNLRRVIPGRAVMELERLASSADGDCTMTFSDGSLRATFGNVDISTTLLTGDFLDWRNLIPGSFATEVLVRRDAIQSAIDRASIMASSGRNNLIRLRVSPNAVRISANSDIGTVEEDVDAAVTGKELEIAFNTKYMIDVFRNTACDEVTMKFNGPTAPCIVTPKDDQTEIYLVLPVRVM